MDHWRIRIEESEEGKMARGEIIVSGSRGRKKTEVGYT